jgi:hypothetical protein
VGIELDDDGHPHPAGAQRLVSARAEPRARAYDTAMPTCRECSDEVTKLVAVKVAGKPRKMCAECADRLREAGEIAEASEGVIQGMMGYKGRR